MTTKKTKRSQPAPPEPEQELNIDQVTLVDLTVDKRVEEVKEEKEEKDGKRPIEKGSVVLAVEVEEGKRIVSELVDGLAIGEAQTLEAVVPRRKRDRSRSSSRSRGGSKENKEKKKK